jgi:hypothetical protein
MHSTRHEFVLETLWKAMKKIHYIGLACPIGQVSDTFCCLCILEDFKTESTKENISFPVEELHSTTARNLSFTQLSFT